MPEIAEQLFADDPEAGIARTLLLPYLNHAATMVESGYASVADIDAGMRFGCGYPVGPLALVDQIGADRVVEALRTLAAETRDPLHEPAGILVRLAERGEHFTTTEAPIADAAMRHAIRRVGVVGTGTMAAGIVQVFAQAGYDVVYVGRSPEKLDHVIRVITANIDRAIARGRLEESAKASVLDRLVGSTERAALADVDIVVEAIAEDLDIKRDLFADLDRLCKPGAIMATTTSSLSIAECAAATSRPHDVIGMHFFNPAPVMKLVEVVTTDATSADVDETVRALCFSTGKHPVSCGDRAGFIVNALLFPYLNDAIGLHERTGASFDVIDAAMARVHVPMGPFALLDVVGNDVALAIQDSLVAAFGHPGWEAAPLLRKLVGDGQLGRKVGRGFRDH